MKIAVIVFYILQRINEMFISRRHEKKLKENYGAVEADPRESLFMKVFHTLWFVALLVESNQSHDLNLELTPSTLIISLILIACMSVRFYSIMKLKEFWVIKIFSLKSQPLITDGLYKYIRHPNYLIVVLEFIFLPLLLKAYVTLFVFSILNIFSLLWRIRLEEKTLMSHSNYAEKFAGIKRFTPFFLVLFMIMSGTIEGKELTYKYKNYDEAKKAENFIKFEGASTKLGLITTGFEGYAKEFKIRYDLVDNQLSRLDVIVVAASLDTDIESRNDKMINDILSKEMFPEIHAKIIDKMTLVEGEQTISMSFLVKDQTVVKPVSIKVVKRDNKFLIVGKTSLGIKELHLPDPSIMIAKVKDEFDLNFSVDL